MSTDNESFELPEIPRKAWEPGDWGKDAAIEKVLEAASVGSTVVRGSMGGRMSGWSGWSAPLQTLFQPTLALVAIAFITVFAIEYTTPTAQQTKTYTTSNGQRATVTLADGSTAKLAPATTLRINGREVELTGEAVFTVTQHTNNPFIVRTNNTITRVLGTTFGVRAYTDDKRVQVVVAEGKVSVNQSILAIGDVATVDTTGNPIVTHNANIVALLGWTEGKLSFNGIRFSELVPQLERWYDLDITITDKQIANRPLIGTFQNEDIEDVLHALAVTLGARYERVGRKVTFSSNNNS